MEIFSGVCGLFYSSDLRLAKERIGKSSIRASSDRAMMMGKLAWVQATPAFSYCQTCLTKPGGLCFLAPAARSLSRLYRLSIAVNPSVTTIFSFFPVTNPRPFPYDRNIPCFHKTFDQVLLSNKQDRNLCVINVMENVSKIVTVVCQLFYSRTADFSWRSKEKLVLYKRKCKGRKHQPKASYYSLS